MRTRLLLAVAALTASISPVVHGEPKAPCPPGKLPDLAHIPTRDEFAEY